MKNAFDKIKLSQLYILCNILAISQVRHVGIVKRKYLESALFFDETLSLLEDLKIIRNNSEELTPSKRFSESSELLENFKYEFLTVLFHPTGAASEQIREFLLNFQIDIDGISFKANELEKIKFSDIRNLLLELEFIKVSSDNRTYYVNTNYSDLFVNQFNRQKLSPETLKRKQNEKDSIGLAAEKSIIEYETLRLTDISLENNKIEHTSLENILAGYDIRSYENYFDNNSKRIERYIEVKAVSILDFKFYWSRNEIEMSRVFGERYFLYLLPVIANNVFDTQKLLILNNPYKNVYLNESDWKKEIENISFFKNIAD